MDEVIINNSKGIFISYELFVYIALAITLFILAKYLTERYLFPEYEEISLKVLYDKYNNIDLLVDVDDLKHFSKVEIIERKKVYKDKVLKTNYILSLEPYNQMSHYFDSY